MKKAVIGFYGGGMTLRGTHVALYDYALHNQEILGNQSVVFYDAEADQKQPDVVEKFRRQFKLVAYQNPDALGDLCSGHAVDSLYIIKSGERDAQCVRDVPNLIHAVFPQKPSEQHGEVYAFVSEWLSKECSNGKIPFVPHMISLPDLDEDLRETLNISRDAVVFGCYGGSDSFNLGFVQEAVKRVVEKSRHIHFLFMNISPFAQHERILFLPGSSDVRYKTRFINTCDAMVHARGIGESFGLACGEFSIRNKPVMTYALSPQRCHLDILGDKAIRYKGPSDVEKLFLEFDPKWAGAQDWDCYSANFAPAPVMAKFREVFLDRHGRHAGPVGITPADECVIQYNRLRKKLRSLSRKLYK